MLQRANSRVGELAEHISGTLDISAKGHFRIDHLVHFSQNGLSKVAEQNGMKFGTCGLVKHIYP